MKNSKYFLILFALLGLMAGCNDFFEPEYNNNLSEETVFNYQLNPEYVAGLYVPAYGAIPGSYTTFGGDFLDCVTDNAVSNNYESTAWKVRTISDYLTSANYPIYTWGRNYRYIKDIYKFLSVGLNDDIVYRTSNAERNVQIKKRMKGEAYFLLALNYFELLRDYAGPVNGEIMGVPIVDRLIDVEEAKLLKRNTFDECVDFILTQIDTALNSGLLPEYSDNYVNTHPELNLQSTIYGDGSMGLPSTTACYALKSRLLLYAASPAFAKGKSASEIKQLYTEAAKASKKVIDAVGQLPDIYKVNTIDDAFFTFVDFNPELILRRSTQTKSWEENNYPPVLGLSVRGRTNPSQNLVDAFPMANGYPISDVSNSGYNASNPYANRDPRFYMTVTYNNAIFRNTPIQMWEGGNCSVGAPGISDDSRVSRTNYYLRKWITQKPSFIPGISSETPWHFAAMFRAVEAYLNFAEAANAAVGPDVAIEGMTAREAIRAVRARAGVAGKDPAVASDAYLASLTDITDLIKNERRIELCFEGHRFYDIRRWGDDLNIAVRKAEISTPDNGATFTYDFNQKVYPTQVTLPEYMRYGAIPRSEILTCPELKQNDGWK